MLIATKTVSKFREVFAMCGAFGSQFQDSEFKNAFKCSSEGSHRSEGCCREEWCGPSWRRFEQPKNEM